MPCEQKTKTFGALTPKPPQVMKLFAQIIKKRTLGRCPKLRRGGDDPICANMDNLN